MSCVRSSSKIAFKEVMSQISGEGNSYLWRGDKKIGLFFVNCECFTSFSVVFSVNGKRGHFVLAMRINEGS